MKSGSADSGNVENVEIMCTRLDSIAVSVFADIFIELTNTEMAATTLWALEWMWEIIQKWSWDWTEDLAKTRAGFVKNSTGFLAIIQLVFATANLDWTRFLRQTLQKNK